MNKIEAEIYILNYINKQYDTRSRRHNKRPK